MVEGLQAAEEDTNPAKIPKTLGHPNYGVFRGFRLKGPGFNDSFRDLVDGGWGGVIIGLDS